MLSRAIPGLLLLLRLSYAQEATSSVPISSSEEVSVTVTSVSTLAIIIIPTSSTSSNGLGASTLSTAINTVSTSSALELPTAAYTGQALLTGLCDIPQYTKLALHGGAFIEVPLLGCSDDRLDCCPSLSPPKSTEVRSSISSMSASSSAGLVASGIISKLSASPVSICPHDYADIDPVCCPKGYSLYQQPLVGGITPCYTMLTTAMPLPASVSSSIISAVEETASTAATVSVIVNQVYALGLPCADDDEAENRLSTGAKIGIGVASGVGGVLLLILLFIAGMFFHRSLVKKRSREAAASQLQGKHEAPNPYTMSPTMNMNSPPAGPISPQFPSAMAYGIPPNQGYSPTIPHPSWISQASVPPQYRTPTVEMQAPQFREIFEADADAKVIIPPESEGPATRDANVSSFHITLSDSS